MNVSDLIDAAVAAEPKLTKAQAKVIVDSVFKSLTDAAVKGEEVSIPGFGKFKVQAKPARTGRNRSAKVCSCSGAQSSNSAICASPSARRATCAGLFSSADANPLWSVMLRSGSSSWSKWPTG